MKEIIIATKNQGKMVDFKKLFAPYQVEVKSLLDLGETLPDIEETGSTFEENALLKAKGIADILQLPVIADDSGLEVDALGGDPGVYSARYAGLEKNDEKNLEKVLKNLQGIENDKRTARFICVLAVVEPGKKEVLTKGICEGRISNNPRGENGFGYDPIFFPIGKDVTLAEMSGDEKNKISHRRQAMHQLKDWLKTRYEER
ncbi:XTP/dITP diphosphatase [Saliterribacillus persicus]|uniref:dITP/XTP pyrophosphatase n=1 Tax=Saliterribacillus persicus TaxID=930114 RepID=A0A368XGQ0_9BACI|nr:XTP/dITP diphosphatase [Saliterribacillus persicus]RCW66366.1 XTP/dITP diphosphohydrolase [Saliterribacillus persicus]